LLETVPCDVPAAPHWADVAEAAANHPSLTPGSAVVLSVRLQKYVANQWTPADKHAFAFLVDRNNQYALFDPNLGVFRLVHQDRVLIVLAYLMGYAYEQREGRVATPPEEKWTVFRLKDAPTSQAAAPLSSSGAIKEAVKRQVLRACEARGRESRNLLQQFAAAADAYEAARQAFLRSGSWQDSKEDRARLAAYAAYAQLFHPAREYSTEHSMVAEFNAIASRVTSAAAAAR
jgi:hypothetical protein